MALETAKLTIAHRPAGPWWAGLDLGGTNLKGVAVDSNGNTFWSDQEPVHRVAADPAPFGQLGQMLERAIEWAGCPPVAIGLGASGPLDLARGTIENPATLPPHLNGPVTETLEARFGRPVFLLNDADAAALGEYEVGAGRGAEICVAVTLGTGIGVGVVRRGSVVLGADLWHPEGGHAVVDMYGPPCTCGGRGCWESICSGTAIERAFEERSGKAMKGPEIGAAAAAGDQDALATLARAAEALGAGLLNVIALVAPSTIVIAGGAVGYGDLLLGPARRRVSEASLHLPERVAIEIGALGGMAGPIGASSAARSAMMPG